MKRKKLDNKKLDLIYRIAFHSIKMMHDGPLLRLLVNPGSLLEDLGLRPGDTVLEPGCGPGFFSVGAAAAVGGEGRVYSYDVNPYAIRYLRKKLDRKGLRQVTAEARNAADSGLPDASVDFSFITGIPRALGGFDRLMNEIIRTLKPGGIFAYRGHGGGRSGFDPEELKSWQLVSQGKVRGFAVFRKNASGLQ